MPPLVDAANPVLDEFAEKLTVMYMQAHASEFSDSVDFVEKYFQVYDEISEAVYKHYNRNR